MNIINDKILDLNRCSLNKFYTEEQIAAENLANSSTPGYKSKVAYASCGFLGELEDVKKLLEGKCKQRINFKMELEEDNDIFTQRDENSVNRDKESINMTRANFGYKCASTCINSRFSMLSTVINSK